MANDKSYDRHINIWINGKEVKNDLASMEKELYKMRNEWKKMTVGTQEWIDKGKDIQKLKGIVDEHNASIRKTPGLLDKIKGSFGMITGVIAGAVAGFQSLKGIIEATDNLSDKFAATLGGMKEGFNAIKQAIATGNFTNFFRNLADAYKEGKRYAETLDEIGDKTRAMMIIEEDYADKILELRLIQQDATKSNEEQIAAGKKIEKLQAELAQERVTLAKESFDNEKSVALERSKLSENELMSLLHRDKAYMDILKTGEKYVELQNKLRSMQTVTPYGSVMGDPEEAKKIVQEIRSMGEEGEKAARIFQGWDKVTEDQRISIIGLEASLRQASRSAREEIMRPINRLNSDLANAAEEAKKTVDKIRDYYKKYGLNEAEAREPGAAYNPTEFMKKEEEDIRKAAEKKAEKDKEDSDEQEKKKQDAWLKSLEAGTEAAEKEWTDRKKQEKEALDDMILYYMGYAEQVGEIMGSAIAEGNNLLKAAAKATLLIALEEFSRLAKIWEGQIYAKSIVQYGVIKGVIRATAISALIETALAAARGIVMKNLWSGGYTGSGSKYEPRGIVHAGEWVANAEMVQSPRTGPIIRALENERQRSGGFATGGYTETQGAGTKSDQPDLTGLILTASRAIERLNRTMAHLDKNGVRTVWGYRDVDNVRRGMEKLEEIENDVTM